MELRTVISDQMIKYQLIDTRFDQISDDKHDIYLYGKLLTELLVQAANKSFRCFPCPCPCPWSMVHVHVQSPCFRSSLFNQKHNVVRFL